MLPEVWLSSIFFFRDIPFVWVHLHQGSGLGESISSRAEGEEGGGGRCAFFWVVLKIFLQYFVCVCAPVLLSARLPRLRGWWQGCSLLSRQGMFCLYMTFLEFMCCICTRCQGFWGVAASAAERHFSRFSTVSFRLGLFFMSSVIPGITCTSNHPNATTSVTTPQGTNK